MTEGALEDVGAQAALPLAALVGEDAAEAARRFMELFTANIRNR